MNELQMLDWWKQQAPPVLRQLVIMHEGHAPPAVIGDLLEENGGKREWATYLGAPFVTGGYLGGTQEAIAWRKAVMEGLADGQSPYMEEALQIYCKIKYN